MTTDLALPDAPASLNLRIDSHFRVDKSAATLHDLALMTGGRVAAGHGKYIDQKTLQTGLEAIQASGGQLRAAIKHPSMLDRLTGRSDRVLDMPGFFSDVRIEGNKLVAGKFEFFETFKAKNPDAVATLLEMAEKTPGLFGLSAELQGTLAYVATDGTEYAVKSDPRTGGLANPPPGIELSNAGLPTLRIKQLGVAAFVDQPAANDGLFARLSSLFTGAPDTAALERVIVAFSQFLESGALHTAAINKGPAPTIPTDMSLATITAIKAEFGADQAKFSQAMTLLGHKPEITIEALKAEMVQADLASALADVTRLTAELSTAKTSLSAAEKARDEWKVKFEQIKNSGHFGIDLGSATADQIENPWAPGKVNLTRQIEIANANPALAATLKAAAAAAK